MTGGLLQLVSYGIEDDILISNPEITFFKTVHRRYTNFSIDTIQTLHEVKFGSTINIPIPKSGDLLYKIFVKLELPKVVAKYKSIQNTLINYDYTYQEYTKNTNIIFNQINILNKIMTDFYLYVDNDKIKKLYNLFESYNLMFLNFNLNNNKTIKNSKNYYFYLHNLLPVESDGFNIIKKHKTNILYDYKYYLLFNYKYNNYLLVTSYDYFNTVRDNLYNTIMLNSYLRQEYMMYKYGYSNIDDIMINVKVKGNLSSYTGKKPKYLIFVDKDDDNILVPIIINNINNINDIYSYVGYIVDIDYYNIILNYNFIGFNSYLKFEKIIIDNNNNYREIELTLKILEKKNNIIKLEGNKYIYDFIFDIKYALYICNWTNRLNTKNHFDDNTIDLSPMAIILISDRKYLDYIEIEYTYSKRSFDINNLKLLSPYIPIPTKLNTYFEIYSTDTDYKLQIDYLNKNNLSTETALNIVSSYIDTVFKILNQMYNSTPLTIKNTINSDLTINMDTLFNNNQIDNYKKFLQIDIIKNNTLYNKTVKYFNEYLNNLINSYQFISSSNNQVLNQLINIYKIINSYKNIISGINFKKSIDTNSFISVILYENNFKEIYEYEDIQIKLLQKTVLEVDEIYRIRLKPYIKNFNIDQTDFIKSGNQLFCAKDIKYNSDFYTIYYYYSIIYIIDIIIDTNNNYIDIYVKTTFKIQKNGIFIDYTNQDFINQQLSYIPTKFDDEYVLQSENNPNILFKLTNESNNSLCYLQNYFISKQITDFIENIWFLQKYNNISDIIPFPNYYHSKFNYDLYYQSKPLNNISNTSIINLYLHDIYILISYDIYKDLIKDNNSNLSNIIGLIIQDTGYTFTSLFKDPKVVFENFKKYDIKTNSLEEEAIIQDNYENNPNNGYNLYNIISNNLIYSIDKIINIVNDIIIRLDKQFINYLNNQNNFILGIDKVITDSYIQEKIKNLLNNKITYNNVIKVLENCINIKLLTLSTANNIINNLIVSKDELKTVLDYFSLNTFEYFNITELYNYNKYNDIFNYINNGIKKYFNLYFRNSILIQTYITNFNKATIDNLINLFSNQIIDFTNRDQINASLDNLKSSRIISDDISRDIQFNILNRVDNIIIFNNNKSLSYYEGINLLKNVKNILISDINFNTTSDDILNNNKLREKFNFPVSINNIENILIKLTNESLIDIYTYNNILTNYIFYDLNLTKIINKNIKIVFSNSNKLIVKSILLVDSALSTSKIINTNYNSYDFFNQLCNTNLMLKRPDLIYKINSNCLTLTQQKGIIDLCNTESYDLIEEMINKLPTNININNKITNQLFYDKLFYIKDLTYYEKIFYLYNYIITQFYEEDILISATTEGIQIDNIILKNCFTFDNYKVDYNIDNLLTNIETLINYLIPNPTTIESYISILLKEYTQREYTKIYTLINKIKSYQLDTIDNIKLIIYNNFDIFIYLLIHIANCLNLRDLISNKNSKIENNIINNSDKEITTINYLLSYIKGNIIYNYNLSIFYNFGQMINEQKNLYIQLYDNLFNMNDIGVNSLFYVDLYKTFNVDDNNIDYFFKYTLNDFEISNDTYKTNFTYMYYTSYNDLYQLFVKILLNLKNNITNYTKGIKDLDYISNKFNIDQYYSDINSFYNNEINSLEKKPSEFVNNIFIEYLDKYKNNDIINFMNISLNNNIKLDYKIRNSYLKLGLKQIIELYNRNQLRYISDNYVEYHYNKNDVIIINDYVGIFYTTQLDKLNEKNQILKFNNTKVSEKITDVINTLNILSLTERSLVIKLNDDIPEINRKILNNQDLIVNETEYIYYNIIMTKEEYNDIINGTYNFEFGSIAKFMNKYYRKTDLPFEYKYDFINNEIYIKLRYNIDQTFLDLYYQISIFMDDIYNIESDEQNLIIEQNIINKDIITVNKLLSESHKLIKVDNKLVRVKSVFNYTKIIILDYPYYLLFNEPIENIIEKIDLRKANNKIMNKYNGTFYIYHNNLIYQYDKVYIDYENDFLILSFMINGQIYNITDIIIRSNNNKLEIEFKDYIKINKYYNKIECIDIYIKNLNQLYIAEKYYIKNDDTVLKSTIINIEDFYSEIQLYNNITTNKIYFGLINLLDLIDTSIFDTNGLMIEFNINFNDYLSDYYRKINKKMTTSEYIDYIIGIDITEDKLEDKIKKEDNKLKKKSDFYILFNTEINLPTIPVFSYIPYMCDYIFNKIKLNIDGNVIDELKDGYQYIYHNFINDRKKQISYYRMNSNNEKLLIESNTKEDIALYIELPLYFSQIPGLAYPLISNLYSQTEIIFILRNLEDMIIKNHFVELEHKNIIKMTMIYSIIYLEEKEREMFSNMRQEYLIEKKIYNSSIQLDISKKYQDKFYLGIEYPIKDIFYYIQSRKNVQAKQYYNFTFNYLLPELDMTTIYKLIYLQQTMNLGYYDTKIKKLYDKCINLMLDKIIYLQHYLGKNIINKISLTDLKLLYNNLTKEEISMIETYFSEYYESCLKEEVLDYSILYLNSVERYKIDDYYSNKIVAYQNYNNIIPGLQSYSFSLHALEYQPAGYVNLTALKPEFRLILSDLINKLNESDILNTYMIGRSYNILRFISGIVGLAWQ